MLRTKVAQNWISYKKLGGRTSLSTPEMELEGSKDLPFLRYYDGHKWESRFTLALNAAKNIDYTEKCFKQKLSTIKFAANNSVYTYLYLSQEWS